MTEHFFVQRSRPPVDHAAFVNQTAGELGQATAFGVNLTVDHFVNRYPECFALLDQDLDMTGDARIHQLVTDLADVWRHQIAVAREYSLVALVNDQVKIIDFHRITVPVPPKKLDRFEGQFTGFKIAHERAAEDAFVPARIHALLDIVGKSLCLGGGKLSADFQ